MTRRKIHKIQIGWPVFTLAVTLLYSLAFVSVGFMGQPVAGLRGWLTIIGQWVVVTACCGGVIGAISVDRRVFAILFPLLCGLSGALAFFQLTMGVGLTPVIVELMMMNGARVWGTMVSPQLIFAVVVAITAGIGIAVIRWKCVTVSRPADFAMLSILVMLIPGCFVKKLETPVMSRMPYVFYGAVAQYLDNREGIVEQRDNFVDTAAEGLSDGPDVVFVIGESLRADHLSLNGYPRPTTPHLQNDSCVVSVAGMFTIPCYTHTSIPHILTAADSLRSERAYDEQSFITLFKNAGYRTVWIANQDVANTYAYFMHEADTLIYTNAAKSLYDFGKWLDKDILPEFDRSGLEGDRNLVILHTIGSHWWYGSHYEEEDAIFQPEAKSRVIGELTQEQIVNSYDNTIVATDKFLAELISRMRERNALVIFISDHGEALGEDGKYLHGEDYPTLHNPACFIWYSEEYARRYPEKIEALRVNATKRWLTDALFHTALDGASIRTAVKIDSLSLFSHE